MQCRFGNRAGRLDIRGKFNQRIRTVRGNRHCWRCMSCGHSTCRDTAFAESRFDAGRAIGLYCGCRFEQHIIALAFKRALQALAQLAFLPKIVGVDPANDDDSEYSQRDLQVAHFSPAVRPPLP